MAKTTVVTGIVLILIGLLGYMGSDTAADQTDDVANVSQSNTPAADAGKTTEKGKSITALIPAFVGAILLICGLVAFKESFRKDAMHAAAVVGLLGFLAGAGRGSMGIGKFLSGDPSLNQRSFLFVWLMAIVCAVFLVLCIQSFRNARKERELANDAESDMP